jgi:hypothetical protein
MNSWPGIQDGISHDVNLLKSRLDLNDPATAEALLGVETFCAIALRTIAEAEPHRLRKHVFDVGGLLHAWGMFDD